MLSGFSKTWSDPKQIYRLRSVVVVVRGWEQLELELVLRLVVVGLVQEAQAVGQL